MKNYPSAINIVDNKIRFNKNFDKNSGEASRQKKNAPASTVAKGVLIRKYKIGELPDIQIATKDLLDPMLFLASHDH